MENQGISLLIKKGRGRNVIDTINEVDEVVQSFKSKVPSDVNFTYAMDSREIMEDNVNSLQGNIILATIFVIIVTMLALGIRSSLIVGSGIPVSILIALFVLYVLGYDYNFMVIFGMLVALGMLIDGSLVVVELADRKMLEGFDKKKPISICKKNVLADCSISGNNPCCFHTTFFLARH